MKSQQSVQGTTWFGTAEWLTPPKNYKDSTTAPVKIEFLEGGRAVKYAYFGGSLRRLNNSAIWKQDGNAIYIGIYMSEDEINWEFEGTIDGNQLSGVEIALDTQQKWSWKVIKE